MQNQEYTSGKLFNNEAILIALECSPEATAIYTGEEMTIQFANAGMLEVWGKDKTAVGKPLLEALPELHGQPFLSLLRKVWHSGITYSVKDAPAELIRNGIHCVNYYDYEYKAILNGNNEVFCILNTARDVTSRREYLQRIKQKEETEQALNEEMAATLEELTSTNEDLHSSLKLLAESREQVRAIIEQAPVGIAMLQGPQHIIELANPAILKIWGREEYQVKGLAHKAARPEMGDQPVNGWLDEVFKTGVRKTNNELRKYLKHNDGLREAIVNSIYQPVFSPSGEVTGVMIILEEITQQVMDRQRNEKDQQMLTMAIEAGNLATFYYEPQTNLFSGNSLLKAWFGLSPDEHIDLSIALNNIVEADRMRVQQAIIDVFSEDSDGHYFIEYSIKSHQDFHPRLVQASGKVFYDSLGKASSLNGTLRDITQQRKEEKIKDDFMGVVSHELKTPLTSLNAYLQVMQRRAIESQNSRQIETLEKSLRQIRNMNGMINGFLNLSRLDSKRMFIQKSDFNLEELFQELEEEAISTIHTHKIIFEPGVPLVMYADRDKISQVVLNLLGNATKYSSMGTQITVEYQKSDNGTVSISVKDEGMGIATEDHEKIFERYYRVQNAQHGSISGFGIGLYFCKEIVEFHHGTINVDSQPGLGTTFNVTLPINK